MQADNKAAYPDTTFLECVPPNNGLQDDAPQAARA